MINSSNGQFILQKKKYCYTPVMGYCPK